MVFLMACQLFVNLNCQFGSERRPYPCIDPKAGQWSKLGVKFDEGVDVFFLRRSETILVPTPLFSWFILSIVIDVRDKVVP